MLLWKLCLVDYKQIMSSWRTSNASSSPPAHTAAPVPLHLPAASVRLVHPNKSNTTAGRVEVKHNGVWGTVCSHGFNNAAATVVCRQVGHAVHRAFTGA